MSNFNKADQLATQKLSGVFEPKFAGVYEKDSAILFSGKFYICVRDTVWLDEINEDWNEYTGRFIYQYKGVVEKLSDLPEIAINGACVFVKAKSKTYAFNGEKWHAIDPVINLTDYVLREEIDEIIQDNIDVSIDGTGFVKTEALAEILTEYLKESKLNDILKDYVKLNALDDFVVKSDLSSILEDYATKQELQEKIDSIDVTEQLTEYAKKTELETLATKESLIEYARTESLSVYAKESDLNVFAKTSDVESILEDYVKTDKLDDLALKTELLDYTHKETTEALDVRTKNIQSKDNSLFFVNDGFELDLVRQVWRKPTFDTTRIEGYSKGDIIWLLPPDYGTLWTPPATEVTYPWVMGVDHPYNLLGKAKTYQAQTSLNLYAIRLRSTKDNNTDNPITDKSCIGSSWVVDEPWAVVEEGLNTVSGTDCLVSYKAGGKVDSVMTKSFTSASYATDIILNKPVKTLVVGTYVASFLNSPAGSASFSLILHPYSRNTLIDVGISVIDWKNLGLSSGTAIITCTDYWY